MWGAMKALLLILALSMSSGGIPSALYVACKKCSHGCESYACKRANCGKVCKMGPNCRGRWKA